MVICEPQVMRVFLRLDMQGFELEALKLAEQLLASAGMQFTG